jgi:hypothetical protein
MERVFLDWDGGLLGRAAKWLTGEFGGDSGCDLSGVVVALPGARPGRILEELLAREVGAGLRPPKIVTSGVLSDELLDVEGSAASRLVRTLAWERALRELPSNKLARVVARPPAADDHDGWATLAEEVRGLFGEIAAAGLDFAAVAQSSVLEDLTGEVQRWLALGMAQEHMVSVLDEVGLHDPHIGRLTAIEAGRVRQPRHVVLIGVVEMNELLRRALTLCGSAQTALVFAPEAEAQRFDSFGCLLAGAWTTRETPLDLEQWQVVDRPGDQAWAAARVIASWGGEYRAEQISVGIANAEVSPYLKRRLAESGIRARDAAGVAMARTAAVRLLTAVGAFLRSSSFQDFAGLVRHPDFESAMRRAASELEPIDTVDKYHGDHLPWHADGSWSADLSNNRDIALLAKMKAVWRASNELLGELRERGPAPVEAQTSALRRFFERIYGEHEIDAGIENGRVLIASLRCLAKGLIELEDLPGGLLPKMSISDTIKVLLRVVSNKGDVVAPAAARAGEPTIEMLGWLELSLDDAPALVVTGFEDGNVPESVRGDAYLPNRLRRELGLVDDDNRLARDMYATELLVRSRERVAFITGRRSLDGDPQVPSRVVFHCAESDVAPRVRRFLTAESARTSPVESSHHGERELPRRHDLKTPDVITVSAFKTFLESPYAYYLQHVMKLRTLDDRAQEMDGGAFGNLAHEVLQRFGQDPTAREGQDPEEIANFLVETLRALGADVYGQRPWPAVQLQLQQLELRLQRFARLQAKRRAAGWRIHAVEWGPEGDTMDLVVDGEAIQLKGRIDRIDYHEGRNEWAVWDYKTGDSIKKPESAHRRRDGTWIDLQLPLYEFLVSELLDGARPRELGYIAIGRDENSLGFWNAKDWRRPKDECDNSDEALDKGLDVAMDIVRTIRAGDIFRLDGWQPYDEIFSALGGVGLVGLAGAGEAGVE